MFTYQCVKKDVFYDVFGYTNPDTVTERNYTTSDGVPLLFLESEQSGMILADREDCFLSLSIMLDGNVSLEKIAECFDFTIQPQAPRRCCGGRTGAGFQCGNHQHTGRPEYWQACHVC